MRETIYEVKEGQESSEVSRHLEDYKNQIVSRRELNEHLLPVLKAQSANEVVQISTYDVDVSDPTKVIKIEFADYTKSLTPFVVDPDKQAIGTTYYLSNRINSDDRFGKYHDHDIGFMLRRDDIPSEGIDERVTLGVVLLDCFIDDAQKISECFRSEAVAPKNAKFLATYLNRPTGERPSIICTEQK